MSSTSKRLSGWDTDTLVLAGVLALLVLTVTPLGVAVHVGNRLEGAPQNLPVNPLPLLIGLARGTLRWPGPATGLLIGFAAIILLLAGLVLAWARRGRSRVDPAARHMSSTRDLDELTERAASQKATRFGVNVPGLVIAATVTARRLLYQGWEDVSVHIWGTRRGKTTSIAVPAILDAPGAVLVTSNKRDVVDATRDLRLDKGPVWVFDPQGLVNEPPNWWWNPLSYVVDEVNASKLADVFTTAARDLEARTDAYFDKRAQQLLADLLLAAASNSRELTQVYLWLTRPTDDEPAAILREHGYLLNAAAVEEAVNQPERQRGGVYGTAQQTVSFMLNRQAMQWVTPGPGIVRREFDPHEFVRGSGTLYSLSKEGQGTAAPLVTAMTVAVTEAAEELAKRSPGGRLLVPLVGVLDEAANVCRWGQLPDLYSHYGSRGIILLTILQGWSQGVAVWGKAGMDKLWSAANVRTYGGGVAETEYLENLSRLIGDVELPVVSTSTGRGGRSVTHSTRRERVLDVADLAALPKGRVIVLGSGARPALARTLPWMEGPHATAVEASIRAHDPAAEQTLADARQSLREVRHQEHTPRTGEQPSNPWVRAS